MSDKVRASDIVILKKMHGGVLSEDEIKTVVEDISSGVMGDIKITGWLASLQANGMTDDEVVAYTRALLSNGTVLEHKGLKIFDFHSIGGITGNKITPILVSIVSSAGLIIPKTSTRAITSACGTVDFVETFCDVEFTKEKLWDIIMKSDGFFVMAGGSNFCPADDIMLSVERKLRMNPKSQFFASILGKKKAMGINNLLIDIPTGPTAKIKTMEEAEETAKKFITLGKRLGIDIKVSISNGRQPLGYATGPILEARECIKTLMDPENAPADVVEKICTEAGILIEMGGIKDGYAMAREILFCGRAYKRFLWIVNQQNGKPDLKYSDLKVGDSKVDMIATDEGYVSAIDHKKIITVARVAGSPAEKTAGVILRKKVGDKVKKGDVLMEIYSSNQSDVDAALEVAEELLPFSYSVEPPENIGPMLFKLME